MIDEEKKELKGAVREAMREILAEQRPMPVPAPPAPVTEIVIRCGPPEAVQVLGGGISPFLYCCPKPPPSLNKESEVLLKRIQDKVGVAQEVLIDQLELRIKARQLAEEIEKFAKELEVE